MRHTSSHRGPADFDRVSPTKQEIAAWAAKHPNQPHGPGVYRVQCVECGKRLWGSGLGIGSHRRGCTGAKPAVRDERGIFHCRQCDSVHGEIDTINVDGTDTLVCFDCGVRERVPRGELFPEIYHATIEDNGGTIGGMPKFECWDGGLLLAVGARVDGVLAQVRRKHPDVGSVTDTVHGAVYVRDEAGKRGDRGGWALKEPQRAEHRG